MSDPVSATVVADLFAMMASPEAVGSRRHASFLLDSTRSWVDPNGYRLSDRLWNQRADVRVAIDERMRTAVRRGEDALDVADDLEQWLHPAYQPTRTRNGRVVDDGRRGVLARGPRNGSGSYPARRLMRTEITRIAGVETDEIATELDLDVQWRLSAGHPRRDICDDYAAGSSPGKPRGVYTRADCPPYPPHPQCLCVKTTYDDLSDDELLARLRKRHGLPSPPPSRGTPPKPPGSPAPRRGYERIRADEDQIRTQRDHETAILYDVDGTEVWRKEGAATSVNFTPEEIADMRGRIMTHNHPRGWGFPPDNPQSAGSSFGTADWMFFMVSDLQEIRAISPKYRHILRRPRTMTPRYRATRAFSDQDVVDMVNSANDHIYRRNVRRIDAGELTTAQANADHWHEMSRHLADTWGIEYERQPIDD